VVAKKDTKPETKRDSTKAQSKTESTAEDGFNLAKFLEGTKEELGKVVWPSRQQLISESAAVILMVSRSASLIYLIDQVFGWVSRQVF